MLADHVARSEKWVEVIGPGGVVREWSPLPTRPDNHWFDCLVGCAAAASMVGIKAEGEAGRGGRGKVRARATRSLAQLARGQDR